MKSLSNDLRERILNAFDHHSEDQADLRPAPARGTGRGLGPSRFTPGLEVAMTSRDN